MFVDDNTQQVQTFEKEFKCISMEKPNRCQLYEISSFS